MAGPEPAGGDLGRSDGPAEAGNEPGPPGVHPPVNEFAITTPGGPAIRRPAMSTRAATGPHALPADRPPPAVRDAEADARRPRCARAPDASTTSTSSTTARWPGRWPSPSATASSAPRPPTRRWCGPTSGGTSVREYDSPAGWTYRVGPELGPVRSCAAAAGATACRCSRRAPRPCRSWANPRSCGPSPPSTTTSGPSSCAGSSSTGRSRRRRPRSACARAPSRAACTGLSDQLQTRLSHLR